MQPQILLSLPDFLTFDCSMFLNVFISISNLLSFIYINSVVMYIYLICTVEMLYWGILLHIFPQLMLIIL